MALVNRQTTIVQNGKLTSKANVAPVRRNISAESMNDPVYLSRTLSDMQSGLEAATDAMRSNPHIAPCIVRGVPASIGATVTVRHTLGRVLTGWICVRAVGGAAVFGEILPGNGSYPAGTDPTRSLVLISGCQGFYDFAISGD